MTRRACVLLLLTCLAVPAFAQSRQTQPADPISGIWTDGDSRGLELKFDGKQALTGTLNPGRPNAIPIKTGTFDTKTGTFKIEAERTVDSATHKLTINGKLADQKLTGTFEGSGGEKGTFEFTRKK